MANKDKPEKARKGIGGRPSKFKEEFIEQAYKLCLLGSTDDQIADFFEIDAATLNRWKNDKPEFCESLKKGKVQADAEIAHSLFRRAKGYSHPDTKFATFEGKITDECEYTKHYPPDTGAGALWLKNRQKELWRDKIDHEHTGKNGTPIRTVNLNGDLDAEQAQKLYKEIISGAQGE